MIAASHLNLENGVMKELPQYADSIIFEVEGTGSFNIQFQHSADGVNFYAIGPVITGNGIMALDNAEEHIFLNVKAVITGTGTVNICKVHFRRHKR